MSYPYTPEQIAEFVAAAQGKTFTAVDWCKGDKCDPCVEKFNKFYFALIPGTANAFYTFKEEIPGTLGNPPNVDPSTISPSSPPGWSAFYGDGTSAGKIQGYVSGGWALDNALTGESFVADPSSPFPPGDPRTPGTWTVQIAFFAMLIVSGTNAGSFIEFPVNGDKIKALQAENIPPPIFYTQQYVDASWGVGYSYEVDHILIVEVPIQ